MLFHCTYNSEYKNKLYKYKLKRGKTHISSLDLQLCGVIILYLAHCC